MKRFPLRRKAPIKRGKKPERTPKGCTTLERLLGEGKVFKASTFRAKPKPMKKRKVTGERDLFRAVWEKRPHQCEACSKPIDEARPHNFSHALPKNAYPDYRLDERNIDLLCMDCHDLWHKRYEKLATWSPEWKRIADKYLELKLEANTKKR